MEGWMRKQEPRLSSDSEGEANQEISLCNPKEKSNN